MTTENGAFYRQHQCNNTETYSTSRQLALKIYCCLHKSSINTTKPSNIHTITLRNRQESLTLLHNVINNIKHKKKSTLYERTHSKAV